MLEQHLVLQRVLRQQLLCQLDYEARPRAVPALVFDLMTSQKLINLTMILFGFHALVFQQRAEPTALESKVVDQEFEKRQDQQTCSQF